jgi:hypothetical protein
MNKVTLVLCLCALSIPALAQPPARCTADEYRQFDFWIGEWVVRNAEGNELGRNTITSIANGCGLLENWVGAGGGSGMSLNAYEHGRWTQRWVGAGTNLWLEGGLDADGNMVMTATAPRMTPRGEVLDRISWSPLEDGRVLQAWDVSTDEGASWTRTFEGYYANE